MKKQNLKLMAKWEAILEQEINLAVEEFPKLTWLLPGTYNAREIHTLLQKKEGWYYYSSSKDSWTDKTQKIFIPEGFFTLPAKRVFYELITTEREAGKGIKNRYRFIKENPGIAIGEGQITFDSVRKMKKRATCLSNIFKGSDGKITFSIKDGSFQKENFKGILFYKEIPLDFEYRNLPCEYKFPIPINRTAHLYGKCNVKLIKNEKTGSLNVLFTREDGWTVSSEEIIPAPVDTYHLSNASTKLNMNHND